MAAFHIALLVAGILLVQVAIWVPLRWWIRARTLRLRERLGRQCRDAGEVMVIEPTACVYRGADARFGSVKGNGVICLTKTRLVFEMLTGRRIEINRFSIATATTEAWFRGKPSFGSGGTHLVVTTTDGVRTGFLMRDAERWARALAGEE